VDIHLIKIMKYLSLFSGIGGFELGIQQAYEDNNRQTPNNKGGSAEVLSERMPNTERNDVERPLSCIGYSEIDKYAIQVYNKQFPNHTNYGDITKINAKELPDFDFLCGGFPCQAFSIAGKRRGFEDTRGTLFFDIARILREKQPSLLLLENVKGLLSHDKGRTFITIISTLDELGYDLQWQVLNSKNFGVPQNRERVFIVGHLRGTSRPEVFPIGQNDNSLITKGGKQPSDAIVSRTLTATDAKMHLDGNYIKQKINVVGTLDEGTWAKRNESIRRVYGTDGLAPTIPTGTGGGVMPKVSIPVLTPDRLKKRQNGRRFKENGDPSFTLTAQDKYGIYDGVKIRRLTPTECERLQGFPDGWTAEGTEGKISDTQRYKMCGNAVTVNVIQAIMEKLLV
jgi:DNA (cytosine-5)-methyltransferase 1